MTSQRKRWVGRLVGYPRVAAPLVGAVASWLICLVACAGVAHAVSHKVRNWPNTPVRHTLKQKIKGAETPSFSENLKGDAAIAGNTLETCPQNLSAARKHRAHKKHKRGARASEPCINANNNDQNMVYVNVDPGGGRFDSSTATLTVPAGARIVRAFLYWAGDLSRGVNRSVNGPNDDAPGGNSPQTNPLYTTALLRAGGGSYATIDATAPNRDGRWDYVQSWYQQPGNAPGWAYQVRADVTSEINAGLANATHKSSGDESIPVTVANVQAGIGYNRYAGWNLVVVWETATAPWRDVTLFDGFDFVQVQGGQQLVVGPLNFTGFQTPQSGKVDAHVTVWATEGDRAITGDYLALGAQSSSCDGLAHQSDAAHPIDNFFNSSISSAGQPVPGRTPSIRQSARVRSHDALGSGRHHPERRDRRVGVSRHGRRHVLLRRDRIQHADPRAEPGDLEGRGPHHRQPGGRRHLHDHREQPVDARSERSAVRYTGRRGDQSRRRGSSAVRP